MPFSKAFVAFQGSDQLKTSHYKSSLSAELAEGERNDSSNSLGSLQKNLEVRISVHFLITRKKYQILPVLHTSIVIEEKLGKQQT